MVQNDASLSRSRQPSRRSSQRLDELRDSGRQSILRPSIHNSRRSSAIGGISRSSTRSSRPGAALPRGQHDKELTTDTVVASTSGAAMKRKSKNRRYDPCAICLEEYEVGDHIRELPCKHFFHSHCIDPWFRDVHGICPVCKRDYSQAGRTTGGEVAPPPEPTHRVTAFLSPLALFAGAGAGHYWYAAEASMYM
ncbi:MAG: hypothetical protein J3Q66DRAFT_345814 [Benniella sp.]|nr:MAG: hypothetical protein J3Q66DRAFT_345814 [Benniella sp.]